MFICRAVEHFCFIRASSVLCNHLSNSLHFLHFFLVVSAFVSSPLHIEHRAMELGIWAQTSSLDICGYICSDIIDETFQISSKTNQILQVLGFLPQQYLLIVSYKVLLKSTCNGFFTSCLFLDLDLAPTLLKRRSILTCICLKKKKKLFTIAHLSFN